MFARTASSLFHARIPARAAALAIAAGAAVAPHAAAATFNITWLDMSPVPMGGGVPNNSNYFLPGVGNVNITYNIPPFFFAHSRGTNASFQNGSVVSGPDTFQWGAHEHFGATNLNNPNTGLPQTGDAWSITYTFPATIPANRIYLGVAGLGRTLNSGGLESTATVQQNGTFLGDWISGNNWGATDFIPGVGMFTMRNSQAGLGGADPWWNTELGVVQINDAISSLTVDFWQLPGDGLILNIGYAVPAPGAAALLGLGGLVALRRRRD
jgi:MYXO-CTERM domain-containing protein